jgi:hypothetical protein
LLRPWRPPESHLHIRQGDSDLHGFCRLSGLRHRAWP